MQIILIISNIVTGIALLSLVFGPKYISILKNKKAKRETLRINEIRKIVREYLEELKND